jgi:hypothetical protein
MRKSLLIYALPAALVVASPFLPFNGRDSQGVSFMRNLGPNVLPIAFWLTVIIFITRCIVSFARRSRDDSVRGFEVIRHRADD